MAKEKISELTAAGALTGAELVPVVQDGETLRTTAQDIADLGGGGASYLVYVALLSQSGTDAPVAAVLENTLGGTVVWSRDDVGSYIGTLTGVFTEGKTWASANASWDSAVKYGNISRSTDDTVHLYTSNDDSGGSVESDDFSKMSVEIRVYP